MQRNLKDWTGGKSIEKNKEGTSKPFPKKSLLLIRQPKQVNQKVTPTIKILMWTHHYGVKQAVVKRKILECLRVGEKLIFRIQTKK